MLQCIYTEFGEKQIEAPLDNSTTDTDTRQTRFHGVNVRDQCGMCDCVTWVDGEESWE